MRRLPIHNRMPLRSKIAVLIAVRSTGRRGWPAGGHTPPRTVARAMVCALIRAAKNITSVAIKMTIANTELGSRFEVGSAAMGNLGSAMMVGLLMFRTCGLRSCLHGVFCRVVAPAQAFVFHHVRGYTCEQDDHESETHEQQ